VCVCVRARALVRVSMSIRKNKFRLEVLKTATDE
jgi:hypothetical protein